MRLKRIFNIFLVSALLMTRCASTPKTQKTAAKPNSTVMPPAGIGTTANPQGTALPGATPATPGATTPPVSLTGSGSPFSGGGSRVTPKSFKSFFDSTKVRTQKGLINVYWQNDRYYFEINKSLLGKDLLAVTRFSRMAAGGSTYGGEQANEVVLRFEKASDNKVFLRTTLNIISSPDSSKPIFKAVKNSNLDPIAAAFDIYAFNRDSTGYIIDITDYFKGDNQVVSVDPSFKRAFNLSFIALDRSYIETIHSLAENTEIRTVKTYNSTPPISFGGPSPIPSGQSLPGAYSAGAVTIEVNTSIVKLPDVPMKRRFFDPRVGYFADQITEFLDTVQRANRETFIVRWRLEPKPEDIEKYKRGELVEPKKQIVYYIDPATPTKWQPYLIQGINDWQVAFEQAGFKNAIVGKVWPADSSMSLEGANYSAIRYLASEIANAYGPNVHDPRSGEIFESHIGWYHNVMKLLQNWYFVQAAAIDPGARKMKFDDALMGDLIRFVSSHEVGHTLGLRHNMGSSSKTPVEKLRDKAWVEAHGHTASIMDYARFNYVAQPEDKISRVGIYPRIGDYDKWAIKWGYRWTDKSEEQDRKEGNTMIIDSLTKNPRLWFGGEGFGNDPRAQTEDLSDNAMKAGEYGIRNLKLLVKSLPEWTREPGDRFQNLAEIYSQLVGQFNRYTNHVVRNIGGVYETLKSVEELGNTYEPVPKAKQKEAVQWVNRQVFQTPVWLLDKNILNKISEPTTNNVGTLQNNAITSIFSAARLSRMLEVENRFGSEAYSVLEMLSDLKKGIWGEMKTGSTITMNRRNLQKTYIDRMIGLLPTANAAPTLTISFGGLITANTKNSDVPSIARGHLADLLAEIKAAIPRTKDQMSRYHLQDEAQRINLALNPKM